MKKSEYKNLYTKNNFEFGNAGSSEHYAKGYCILWKKLKEKIIDKIRKLVEECDSLGGFMIVYSLAGATGACKIS